ncbi:tripartite tricarboxylate transporter family receptor [Bordetella bronchiseptica MBORD762]|uniref:Bug family tripartite tricarboxylate transporter substrate binding protein n=1 Tax=Bordetella bronchiseptica TaxID=518 RepID=UPI0004618AC1|nr:tripartite tricarboxylate transporter substrate binding protein [Bordetella bronchiseptica]KDD85380.1 tripartite tricarboxylate transporter family receptor [Bordetella bronchiseptica MBORD762]
MGVRAILVMLLAFTLEMAGFKGAYAADFPNRPIRLVSPFPPGGTTDIVSRAMAEKLTRSLEVPVIVENRAGAFGMIGTDIVARAPADGYTLVMAGSPHGINNSLRKNVPYDPVDSFVPVALIGTVPMVLVVPQSMPANDYATFVKYGKDNPESLKCGIVSGAANHLATEMFRAMTGLSILQIPYKGDAPMFVDLIGAQINCVIGISTQVLGHIAEGRLKALAVTSNQRLSLLPEVPTLQELGLSDFEAGSWNGVFAPCGTPAAHVRILSDALLAASKDPAVVQSFNRLGFQVRGEGSAELGRFLAADIARWKKVIDDANIRVE